MRPTLAALTSTFALAAAVPATAGAACAGADDAPRPGTLKQASAATLCLLNAERAERGLEPLRADHRLRNAARKHSRRMVRDAFFAHDAPDGSTMSSRVEKAGYLRGAQGFRIGENIAWGSGELSTPRRIVRSWMGSPGHRANILEPAFRDIGIGIAPGAPRSVSAPAATYTTDFGVLDT